MSMSPLVSEPVDAPAPAARWRFGRARSGPADTRRDPYAPQGFWRILESAGAGLLALIWILPLAYAVWAAVHPPEFTTRFVLDAPLTLENFERAWAAAPFARYFLNTFILVTMILAFQLVLGTLAAYALARQDFWGRDVAFALILIIDQKLNILLFLAHSNMKSKRFYLYLCLKFD